MIIGFVSQNRHPGVAESVAAAIEGIAGPEQAAEAAVFAGLHGAVDRFRPLESAERH